MKPRQQPPMYSGTFASYKDLSVIRSSGAIPIMVDLLSNGSVEVCRDSVGCFCTNEQ